MAESVATLTLGMPPVAQQNTAPKVQQTAARGTPTFMTLPAEIRRSILRELLIVDRRPTFSPPPTRTADEECDTLSSNGHSRMYNSSVGESLDGILHLRTRSRATPVLDRLHPNLLRVNQQMREEAAEVLHSNRFVEITTDIDLVIELRMREVVPVWKIKQPFSSARPLLTLAVKPPGREPKATCRMVKNYLINIKDISRLAEVVMTKYDRHTVEVQVQQQRLPAQIDGEPTLDVLVRGPLLPWISGCMISVKHMFSGTGVLGGPMSDTRRVRIPIEDLTSLNDELHHFHAQIPENDFAPVCDLHAAAEIWTSWLRDMITLRETGRWDRDEPLVLVSASLFHKSSILLDHFPVLSDPGIIYLGDLQIVAQYLIRSIGVRRLIPVDELELCGSSRRQMIWHSLQYLEAVEHESLHFGDSEAWQVKVRIQMVLCWSRLGYFKKAGSIIQQIAQAFRPGEGAYEWQYLEYASWREGLNDYVERCKAAPAGREDRSNGMPRSRRMVYFKIVVEWLEPRWKGRFPLEENLVHSLSEY